MVLVALVVGGVLGWVAAALRERARTAAAESRAETALERRSELEAEVAELAEARGLLERKVAATDVEVRTAREQLEAQKAFVDDSRKQLEDAFKALASDALEGSSQQFLKLAEQRWQTRPMRFRCPGCTGCCCHLGSGRTRRRARTSVCHG